MSMWPARFALGASSLSPTRSSRKINRRIETRERERFGEVTARLKEQFAREKADADTKARTALEQVRKDGAAALEKLQAEAEAREAAAREQARKGAEAAAQEKLTAAERARKQTEAALQARITAAEQAKTTAEQVGAGLRSQLQAANQAAKDAIEAVKQEAAAKEAAAREQGRKAAEAAMQERLVEAERQRAEAIAGVQAKLTAAEEAKQAAEQQVHALKEAQETVIKERVHEVREALEAAKTAAVLAEQAKAFSERQKLQAKVQDLQRQIEQERAHELGEGAEIDLFEELKRAFDDRITRVKKGTPGADIIQEVLHHGKVCGRIIYDSKNRNKWDGRYVSKLREDQLAAKAEHAILSSLKFPGRTSQLHCQDGVIIACPARVLALAELLRRHIVQMHTLRASNEERAKKTAALYSFITSDHCRQFLESIEAQVNKLLEIEVSEQNAHKLVWEKRGKLLRAVLKVQGDLCCEIERIIGTADETE